MKEAKVGFVYQSIPVDVVKRSLLFFANELLYRSIREESANESLFGWIYNALTWLDLTRNNVLNYHIIFTLQLSRFLGFYPKKNPGQNNQVFDLQAGQFTSSQPEHPQYFSGSNAILFNKLLVTTFESVNSLEINNAARRELLAHLMTYYRLHLPGFGEMKSIEILRSVLD